MVSWQGDEDGIGGVVTDAVRISQERSRRKVFHQHRPWTLAPNPNGKRERLGVGTWGLYCREQIYLVNAFFKRKNPRYFDTHVLSIWKFCERSATSIEVGEDSSRLSRSKQPDLSNLTPKLSLGPNNVLPEGFLLVLLPIDQGE